MWENGVGCDCVLSRKYCDGESAKKEEGKNVRIGRGHHFSHLADAKTFQLCCVLYRNAAKEAV